LSERRKTVSATIIQQLFAQAGVTVNGPSPWDIQVHNESLYDRILRDRNLGLGEAYMDGWWNCGQLDEFSAVF
jgi:cyclopropane-fatty-acyl-phospholipid synthase